MKGLATRTSIDYTNSFVKFKQEMTKTPSPPAREWKPYREPEALRRNIERCKELTALPSRFA